MHELGSATRTPDIVTGDVSARFASEDDAPHASRVLVREFLTDHGAADMAGAGELLISELVTNVIRHARSAVEIDLYWEGDALRAEVRDGSSIPPAMRDLAGAHGGYGLRIVTALARDWGVTQIDDGKAVWFVLDRRGMHDAVS